MTAERRTTYPLCNARRRDGKNCRLFAGQGTDHKGYGRCHLHGGNTPTHKIQAENAWVAARMEELDFGDEIDIGPGEAMLWMVRLSSGHVEFLRRQLRMLPSDARNEFRHAALNRVYGEERDRLTRICKAAIDAGCAERMVRMAEQYGELLARFIQGVLNELQLSNHQKRLSAEVIPRQLMALEVAATENLPEDA